MSIPGSPWEWRIPQAAGWTLHETVPAPPRWNYISGTWWLPVPPRTDPDRSPALRLRVQTVKQMPQMPAQKWFRRLLAFPRTIFHHGQILFRRPSADTGLILPSPVLSLRKQKGFQKKQGENCFPPARSSVTYYPSFPHEILTFVLSCCIFW